ncbi:MAG: hydroxysqualene dehydroxylase HpnE [Phycisphaerales bacterium]|nr:hydroxysqualene dehydroxylase HpnE [Phycisphaerales bacterium]
MDGAFRQFVAMNRQVVIIGGGLAGIAAAIRLADDGHVPRILETRRKLGGRATSFDDPRSGVTLDNCQHVLMGCCTNLQDLYQRLGVLDRIGWHEQLHWLREDGGIDSLRPDPLPAPLHQARSLLRMRLLDRVAKREVRRAMWRMIRMGAAGRLQWRGRTFLDFLRDQRQSDDVIHLFWDTIIISACNLESARVAAVHGIQVFQEAFLPGRFAGVVGIPDVPLRELYDPARSIIENAGGTIDLGCSVRSIGFEGRSVASVVTADGPIEAATVISTVPPDRLAKILPDRLHATDARTANLDAFESSPILGVHLQLEQPITDLPHLVLAGRPVHWMFNKGTDEDGHQHLHAVISAADDWMELSEQEIVHRVVDELARAFPCIKDTTMLAARSVKEKRATFAATPHVESKRPSAGPSVLGADGGDLQGLYLAGDWCDTGWPATMEGAVRSGYNAAAAINGDGGLVDELRPGPLASLLGLR